MRTIINSIALTASKANRAHMNISVTIGNPPFQKFGTLSLGKRFKLANGMAFETGFHKAIIKHCKENQP
jgi:transketolase N-terminal domain/subunit